MTDEEFADGRITQAEVLEKYDLLPQALEQLEEVVERFPGHVGAQERRVEMMRALEQVDRLPEALTCLATAKRAAGDVRGARRAAVEASGMPAMRTVWRRLLERLELLPGPASPSGSSAAIAAPPPPEEAAEGGGAPVEPRVPTLFVHATRGLAKECPVVVLIEDLHLAPDEGRALFSALARAVPEHRILLIGTARPGLPEAWEADLDRMGHASRIDLDRLGPKDLSMLLVEAFRSERLAEELGFRIATKSDGNPFFVFEIIRGLREGKYIRRRPDGTWVTTKVIEEIGVPSSVLDLIQARIADLEFEERNLLEVAACCGFEFDGRLPAEVLGMERIPGLQLLGQVEKRHGLIRASGPGFVFDHHQLRDTLYAGISAALKEEYHAEIAAALEGRTGALEKSPEDLDGATVVGIAEHFVAGGRRERALHYLDAALDHLENGYQNDRAISLAGRALTDLGTLDGSLRARLLLRRAERLGLLGRREEERADLREAVALADSGDDGKLRCRAHLALGIHHWSVSRHEEARPELERARDLAREAGEREEEAQATGSLGNVSFSRGLYEEARDLYLSYLEIAREVGDVAGEGRALANLGTVHWSLGRYEEARAHYEERLALAIRTGDLRGESRVTGSLGNVFFSLGRHDEAREHYERNLVLARETGDRRWEGVATGNLALVFLTLGLNEKALEGYRRWVTIAKEVGDRRGEASATGNLGSVYENLGRFEEARLQHERGLALAREIGDRRGEGLALVDLGPLHADLGDPDRAREVLDEALAIFLSIGARREEAYALHRLGRLAERKGELSEAARLLGVALGLRRELEYRRGIAESLVAVGGLLQTAGRTDEAREHLEEALALGEELDGPDTVTLTSCRLALLPGGDPAVALRAFADHEGRLTLVGRMEARALLYRATGAPEHLADAHRLLQGLTEHAPLACREAMVTRVPLHREIREAWEARGDVAG